MSDTNGTNTISLAELSSEASLLTHINRKYLAPLGGIQHVISHLTPQARVFQIDDLRHFHCASTYFDTPGLDAYFLATHKHRQRYGVRTHTYLSSDLCFLEVRTGGSYRATAEDRFKYDPDDADRVTPDDRLFATEHLMKSGTYSSNEARTIADALILVVSSTYSCITLHLPHDEACVTSGTRLTWNLFSLDGERLGQGVMVDHLNVVETKNPSTAFPMDRLLWHQGYRPARISRYATDITLPYTNLPTNRWNRTIRRDLGRY